MTGDTDNHWYIARDGQQHGPISETEIRLFVDNGHLRPTDLLWRPGFTDWKPAAIVFPLPEPAPQSQTKSQDTGAVTQATLNPASLDRKLEASNETAALKTNEARKAGGGDRLRASGRETANEKVQSGAGPSAAVARSPAGSAATPTGSAATMAASSTAAGARASNRTAQSPAQTARSGIAGSGSNARPDTHAPSTSALHEPEPRYGALTPQPEQNQPIVDEDVPRGRGRTYALAAALVAMIAGSGFYLLTQKEQILSMFGASATGEVPVVTAEPEPAGRPDTRLATAGSSDGSSLESTGSVSRSQPESDQGFGDQQQPARIQVPGTTFSDATPPPAVTLAPPRSDPPETAMLQPPSAPPSATEPDGAISNATPSATQPDDGKAVIDAYYQKSDLWQFIKRTYPDWYGAQLSETASMRNGGTPTEEATKTLVTGLVALRRRNADHALQADTAKLKAIATAFLANLQALSEKNDDACYSFISQGETSAQTIALFHQPQSAPKLEAQALTIFEAIDTGKTAPASHERPKKEDYDVLAGELGKLGWSQADLQLFADPKALAKAPPTRVCSMVLDWFKAHVAISDAGVQERLLFETLRPVVSG